MARSSRRRKPTFALVGNHRCLDFVNTEGMQKGQRIDLLADFADLVGWLTTAELLGVAEAAEALRRWNDTPAGAQALLAARRLRSGLRKMLEHIVRGRPIPAAALEAINALLARRIGHDELVRTRRGVVRRVRIEPRAPEDLVVLVAKTAGDLLCHADLPLIRKCENPPCLRYFYDRSKNHLRRWCSMSACGNRAKVAAYHRRARRRAGARAHHVTSRRAVEPRPGRS